MKLPKFAEAYRPSSIDGVCEDISGRRAMSHYNQEMIDLTYSLPHEKRTAGLNYHSKMLSLYQSIDFAEKLGMPTGYHHSLANKAYREYVKMETFKHPPFP